MPELPEVEHVRRSLEPHLVGRRVAGVLVRRACVIEGPRTPRALLVGQRVVRLARRGKQMAWVGDGGGVLVVHLGMTGQVLGELEGMGEGAKPGTAAEAPARVRGSVAQSVAKTYPPHTHIVWTTEGTGGGRVLFRDPRRFGGVWTLKSVAALEERWAGLGPDGLDAPVGELAAALVEACRGSARSAKAALLDQAVIAGVGNIYADEACFIAGVRPTRRGARLKVAEAERLAVAVRSVLAAAVEAGGSSLRDYVDADGRAGEFAQRHAVYGRGGEPCVRCGKRLKQATVAQRTTVWCGGCQG